MLGIEERRRLASLLSLVERGPSYSRSVLESLGWPAPPYVVGFTGPGGAGKSSLVEVFGKRWLEGGGGSVAVLAVDPTSPISGGAFLGDRVRMPALASDPRAYVRSVATRGALGGVPASVLDCARVLGAFGFPLLLLETVGAGQDQVDVAGVADTVVLLFPAQSGDAIQTFKAGILELSDVVVVSKADLGGASEAVRELESYVRMGPEHVWRPPVVAVSTVTGEGVDDLMMAVALHRQWLQKKRDVQDVRLRRRISAAASALLEERLQEIRLDSGKLLGADPYRLVEELMSGGRRMDVAVDHVAMALEDTEPLLRLFELLGLPEPEHEVVEGEGIGVWSVDVGGTELELMVPTSDSSPVARFLSKRGTGIHHVALRVSGLRNVARKLEEAGFKLVGECPRVGAGGRMVCFVHPSSTGGILVELVEYLQGDG